MILIYLFSSPDVQLSSENPSCRNNNNIDNKRMLKNHMINKYTFKKQKKNERTRNRNKITRNIFIDRYTGHANIIFYFDVRTRVRTDTVRCDGNIIILFWFQSEFSFSLGSGRKIAPTTAAVTHTTGICDSLADCAGLCV